MDVFNKLKNTVSNLSTVLPGNPVTREYEVGRHIASAGPGLLWKIYQATKRSTKQEAAVFVLDKKLVEKYPKHIRDRLIDCFKKGVGQLTKLRHPSILTVQHPLEESRDSLAFAAEPVFSSLANVLGQHDNLPTPSPIELKDYQLYDVEIKYGLFQIAEGLSFLHNDVKMLHRNICPESIIVNKSGAWKIFGFDFSVSATNTQDKQPVFPSLELEYDLPPLLYPNLEHLAPEYVTMLNSTTASDMFAVGALIYTIYDKGITLYNCNGIPSAIKEKIEKLRHLTQSQLSCIPPDATEHVKMMLNVTPEVRPDSHQFSKLQFFNDVGVKTLQFLDSIYQLDNLQKSQFFKGLPQILAQMPKRVSLHRVLPSLVKEYVNPEMIPFVLPNVLLIAEQSTNDEFQKYILPDLVPVFKLQEPIQILLIFMQKMELLLTKCDPNDIRNYILPMVNSALEADTQQIQELCLNVIPSFASLIEYPSMKNAVLPRIKKICLNTNYLSVRVNTLVCIGKLLEHLDKWLVLDEILPMLTQIPSKEPAVLMGILGIYKLAMDHKKLGITKDIMASQIIPFLMPLSIESGLTLNQFTALINLIKEMVSRVETEQKSKLEQLNSIKQQHSSTLEMTKITAMKPNEIIPNISSDAQNSSFDHMFSGLGLNSFTETKSKPAEQAQSYSSQKMSESLTMEEKQRLVQEQDYQQRIKDQGPLLKPTAMASSSRSHLATTKDLTSTLMNSSLAGLNLNSASGSHAPLIHSSSPVFNSMPFTPNFPAAFVPNQNAMFPIAPPPQTSSNLQAINNPVWNMPQQRPTVPQSFQPFQQAQSMAAFDNLLTGWKNTKTPVQMNSSNVALPVAPQLPTLPAARNVTKTSYKDLEDLLG